MRRRERDRSRDSVDKKENIERNDPENAIVGHASADRQIATAQRAENAAVRESAGGRTRLASENYISVVRREVAQSIVTAWSTIREFGPAKEMAAALLMLMMFALLNRIIAVADRFDTS